jgi:hypothetical protein
MEQETEQERKHCRRSKSHNAEARPLVEQCVLPLDFFFFLRYFAAGFCLASIQFGFILLLVGSLFLRLFLYLYLFKLALYLIKLLNKILDVKKK